MTIQLLAFGIARDILGGSIYKMDVDQGISVGEVKQRLLDHFPQFENLSYLAIAVNNEYATDEIRINATDEVALIPPVSGG